MTSAHKTKQIAGAAGTGWASSPGDAGETQAPGDTGETQAVSIARVDAALITLARLLGRQAALETMASESFISTRKATP
jgi:hypothetical protein